MDSDSESDSDSDLSDYDLDDFHQYIIAPVSVHAAPVVAAAAAVTCTNTAILDAMKQRIDDQSNEILLLQQQLVQAQAAASHLVHTPPVVTGDATAADAALLPFDPNDLPVLTQKIDAQQKQISQLEMELAECTAKVPLQEQTSGSGDTTQPQEEIPAAKLKRFLEVVLQRYKLDFSTFNMEESYFEDGKNADGTKMSDVVQYMYFERKAAQVQKEMDVLKGNAADAATEKYIAYLDKKNLTTIGRRLNGIDSMFPASAIPALDAAFKNVLSLVPYDLGALTPPIQSLEKPAPPGGGTTAPYTVVETAQIKLENLAGFVKELAWYITHFDIGTTDFAVADVEEYRRSQGFATLQRIVYFYMWLRLSPSISIQKPLQAMKYLALLEELPGDVTDKILLSAHEHWKWSQEEKILFERAEKKATPNSEEQMIVQRAAAEAAARATACSSLKNLGVDKSFVDGFSACAQDRLRVSLCQAATIKYYHYRMKEQKDVGALISAVSNSKSFIMKSSQPSVYIFQTFQSKVVPLDFKEVPVLLLLYYYHHVFRSPRESLRYSVNKTSESETYLAFQKALVALKTATKDFPQMQMPDDSTFLQSSEFDEEGYGQARARGFERLWHTLQLPTPVKKVSFIACMNDPAEEQLMLKSQAFIATVFPALEQSITKATLAIEKLKAEEVAIEAMKVTTKEQENAVKAAKSAQTGRRMSTATPGAPQQSIITQTLPPLQQQFNVPSTPSSASAASPSQAAGASPQVQVPNSNIVMVAGQAIDRNRQFAPMLNQLTAVKNSLRSTSPPSHSPQTQQQQQQPAQSPPSASAIAAAAAAAAAAASPSPPRPAIPGFGAMLAGGLAGLRKTGNQRAKVYSYTQSEVDRLWPEYVGTPSEAAVHEVWTLLHISLPEWLQSYNELVRTAHTQSELYASASEMRALLQEVNASLEACAPYIEAHCALQLRHIMDEVEAEIAEMLAPLFLLT